MPYGLKSGSSPCSTRNTKRMSKSQLSVNSGSSIAGPSGLTLVPSSLYEGDVGTSIFERDVEPLTSTSDLLVQASLPLSPDIILSSSPISSAPSSPSSPMRSFLPPGLSPTASNEYPSSPGPLMSMPPSRRWSSLSLLQEPLATFGKAGFQGSEWEKEGFGLGLEKRLSLLM